MAIRAWYRRFDHWLRERAQRHVESDAYIRREKALYDATAAIGRAEGWGPKSPDGERRHDAPDRSSGDPP